eukprot:CAMPEP_0179895812 /NCGR_PEP_ID=MMETSP0982-20121206/36034_1 /TAXON_ID=483367 /ORGANISM="non described non described, Strain CCMP 2436" /LENGTH=250 /DNA_ID=CAMNT_0021792525 /DNA_START=135 /DNA_END=884 /DNA_ORIENTATION=-
MFAALACLLSALPLLRRQLLYATVADEYAEQASEYDERWAAYVNQTVALAMARSAPEQRALKCGARCYAIDVGCGTGALAVALLRSFPTWNVVCADPSADMLARARQRPERLRAVVARSESLPFRSGTFHLATSLSSLHFWDDKLQGLKEITRVLRKGGLLLLTDWSHDYTSCIACSWYLYFAGYPHNDWNILTLNSARSLVREAGLTIVRDELYTIALRPFGLRLGPRWGMMTLIGTKEAVRVAASYQP